MWKAGNTEIIKPLYWLEFGGVTYEVCRHPDLLRLPHISAWVDEYQYAEHFHVPTPIEDRHPAWIEAMYLYSSVRNNINGR